MRARQAPGSASPAPTPPQAPDSTTLPAPSHRLFTTSLQEVRLCQARSRLSAFHLTPRPSLGRSRCDPVRGLLGTVSSCEDFAFLTQLQSDGESDKDLPLKRTKDPEAQALFCLSSGQSLKVRGCVLFTSELLPGLRRAALTSSISLRGNKSSTYTLTVNLCIKTCRKCSINCPEDAQEEGLERPASREQRGSFPGRRLSAFTAQLRVSPLLGLAAARFPRSCSPLSVLCFIWQLHVRQKLHTHTHTHRFQVTWNWHKPIKTLLSRGHCDWPRDVTRRQDVPSADGAWTAPSRRLLTNSSPLSCDRY